MKRGRPNHSYKKKADLLDAIKPYLMAGFPIKDSCRLSNVPRSTVYKHIATDPAFLDKICKFQQYLSVRINQAVFNQILIISDRQRRGIELKEEEIEFLMWVAQTSNRTNEEFSGVKSNGRRWQFINSGEIALESRYRLRQLLEK